MGEYFDAFLRINGLPLLACLMVSGVLVYLGMHVIVRQVIFVDLALAQIAAFGVMWAILMGYNHEEDTVAVTLYSLAFTVIGAVVFAITRTNHERVPHEALIGIIYVTATAAGLVLADRFALGTDAMKELIAGRVALVTGDTLIKLAVVCVIVGAIHVVLYRRFILLSTDPARARAIGMNLRRWDFLFYVIFGLLITQAVGILGVLPVFAYLVIPAVTAAFLFERILNRLIFGWVFAAVISVVGLESARVAGLDPGPTIVCLFAAVLAVIGTLLYLNSRRFSGRALFHLLALTAFFGLFLGGTYMFRRVPETDEFAQAMLFSRSEQSARVRQAIESFRKFPGRQEQWLAVVSAMLVNEDPVVREDAVDLLGDLQVRAAVPLLVARLSADGGENEDGVREQIVEALGLIGDRAAVGPLVAAAEDETEDDIAVEMCEAAFELGGGAEVEHLRKAVDLMIRLILDRDVPERFRRDGFEHLHHHLPHDMNGLDSIEEIASWWQKNRERAAWDVTERRFRAPQ